MLGEISLTISRDSAAGQWVNGYFIPSVNPKTNLPIKASIQPLGPRDLLVLSEGDRVKEWVRVYTTTELFIRRGNLREDQFVHNGKIYSIMKEVVQIHPGFSLAHRLYHACVDNQNNVDKGVVV